MGFAGWKGTTSVISDEAVWSLDARQDGAATVLYPRGELDLDTSPGLLAEVGRRVDSGARRLVVDLAGLTFVDSTGLGAIVGCWRRAARATATFELVNPSPYVLSTLQITGLDTILPVTPLPVAPR
jgi:anti-sigma B factor antagonist